MTALLRVFLADDHAVVREGLKALIDREADMQVIGEAGDGKQAIERIADCETDVAVVDLSMPEMNGMKVTEWMADHCPDVKVVALTVHEDTGYARWLMGGGAKGYILKRTAPDELIHALRTVAAGGTYIDPIMSDKMRQMSTDGTPDGATAQRGRDLSARELEVARLVAQGYSNKEIAASLDISVKTVETHKARLMEKLQLRNRAELVRFAIAQGWLENN